MSRRLSIRIQTSRVGQPPDPARVGRALASLIFPELAEAARYCRAMATERTPQEIERERAEAAKRERIAALRAELEALEAA